MAEDQTTQAPQEAQDDSWRGRGSKFTGPLPDVTRRADVRGDEKKLNTKSTHSNPGAPRLADGDEGTIHHRAYRIGQVLQQGGSYVSPEGEATKKPQYAGTQAETVHTPR